MKFPYRLVGRRFFSRVLGLFLAVVAACVQVQAANGDTSDALLDRAYKGDATAQWEIGVRYTQGSGVPVDWNKAVNWWRKSAEQGNRYAQAMLGSCYAHGSNGIDRDLVESAKWYLRAAEQGHKNAQFNIGNCFASGEGVERNMEIAVSWYERSAAQGLAKAQNALARCYAKGDGVRRNQSQALSWYRKAAEQGDADAQYNLGVCCENGDGLPRDFVDAYGWYSAAAAAGSQEARRALDSLSAMMTSEQLNRAQSRVKSVNQVYGDGRYDMPRPSSSRK